MKIYKELNLTILSKNFKKSFDYIKNCLFLINGYEYHFEDEHCFYKDYFFVDECCLYERVNPDYTNGSILDVLNYFFDGIRCHALEADDIQVYEVTKVDD